MAVLAVGAAPGTGVPQVVLHQHARDHRAALRRAQHRVVLARVEVRLRRVKEIGEFRGFVLQDVVVKMSLTDFKNK